MTEGQLAALLSGVVRHGPRDEKLPHKRLALLFAIARVARGDARLFRFADAEAPVADLISRFGPPVSSPPRPEYPLYRLVNDGDGQLWEIPRLAELRVRENSKGQPPVTVLRDAEMGFAPEVDDLLRRRTDVLGRIVAALLADFEAGTRRELCEAVGLPIGEPRPSS